MTTIRLEPPNEGPDEIRAAWDRFCAHLRSRDPNADPMEVYVSIIRGALSDLGITVILEEGEE